MMNVCTVSVYITAARPPVTVYKAVMARRMTMARYKFHPSASCMKMAPANKSA